jgi:hypothetical protein
MAITIAHNFFGPLFFCSLLLLFVVESIDSKKFSLFIPVRKNKLEGKPQGYFSKSRRKIFKIPLMDGHDDTGI